MKRIVIFCLSTLIFIGISSFYNPLTMDIYRNDWLTKFVQLFSEAKEKQASERVYLHTDKALYKPGETIWFQAYLRNENDLKSSPISDMVKVELIGPRGTIEKEYTLIATEGVASGDFEIAEEATGGLYTIKAYTEWQKNGKNPFYFEKEVQVQKVVLPRLKMKLDFEKEAYGIGDEFSAEVSLDKLNNQPLANHEFTYRVHVEGKVVANGKGKTNRVGKATITNKLPKQIENPDGLLLVMLQHNGQAESISRSIPIVLNKFKVEFFPEGGDLVAGVESKVAFRVLNEFDKPADASGEIFNEKGKKVAEFSSFHQGMGSFNFKPKADESYTAKITSPKGATQTWELPNVLSKGYTLGTEQIQNTIKLTIHSPLEGALSLIGQCRGEIYVQESIEAKKGKNEIELDATSFPIGVTQFTLFDAKGIERAERLVFLNRDKKLNINITPNKEKFTPREEVTLDISITDEEGIPVPGQFSLAVVDDKLLSFTDDKQGNILPKLLLEPDLSGDIYEPNFYFDETEEKSIAALDLLMMTQGWRKFTWKEIREGLPELQQEAEKAIIAGKVQRFGQIVPNVEIKVLPDNISVRTNVKGEFSIQNLKLYEPKTFELHTKKGKENEITVSTYSQNMVIELVPPVMMANRRMARGKAENEPMAMMMMDDVMEEDAFGGGEEAVLDRAFEEVAELELKDVEDDEVAADFIDGDFDDMADEDWGGAVEEVLADDFFMDMPKVKPSEPAIVYYRAREFPVPVYNEEETPEKRTDFRATIFWKGDIVTDRSGKAQVSFPTSDEITAFRATIEGIGEEGTVGRGEAVFFNELPFSMDVKVPVAVSMGDNIQIPLTLTNNTSEAIKGKLNFESPTAWSANGKLPNYVNIPAKLSKTYYIPYTVLSESGKGKIAIQFEGNGIRDAFEQVVNTVAKGFPINLAFSGQEDKSYQFQINNLVAGTLEARLTAYPTLMSDLLSGIESILREPYGCFEQTSSSTYPNLLVRRYMDEAGIDNAVASAKADALIEKGYERLVSFETEENGYEWFGGAPAHEALTAYGLMEFKEMSRVYEGVSNQMVERTAKWLLSRKDGKGGFKKDPKALDSFGRADEDITNAYIVYSMSEAGYVLEIREELEKALENAEKSQDPYQLALITNALFNTKDLRAKQLLAQLQKHQQEDGSWMGKKHSITYSTGIGLQIETTSLAMLANLKADAPNRRVVDKAAEFIVASRSPYGGFGNTQSTIMALRGLTDYATFAKRTQEDGTIEIKYKGKVIATKSYQAGEEEAIVLDNLDASLVEGKNQLSVHYPGVDNPLPYTLSVIYNSTQPNSNDSCKVAIETTLTDNKVNMGETVRLTTQLTNKTKDGLPMTLAVVGIPGGLTPQPWQLKELQEKGIVDFYEVTDRQVVFYYRQMKPSEQREINLDLKADLPGNYESAASTAYLYYTNEHKHWVEGLKVRVDI